MRRRESLNNGWTFHKGDIAVELPRTKGPMYTQAKTERYQMGPASIHYPDASDTYNGKTFPSEHWEYVRLPHDYMVWGTPDENENCTLGYLKRENAWYRKHFTLPAEDKGQRIIIEFEGCSGNSTVYLNGCLLKHNFSTYTSFEVDITDYANAGGENVLAVYLDNSYFEGWWYEGAGIYRNVWLTVTDEIAVDTDGVYIDPQRVDGTEWKALLEATLVSVAAKEETVSVLTEIIDADGNTVARATADLAVPSHARATVKYETEVHDPHLWDIDDPYLYQIKTTVTRAGEVCDEHITRTGFRYYTCDPEKGFFLNGRHVKIKGVCGHEDCGLLGKAIPENVHRYRISLLKEMGANGYRTAHYQQNSAILDALDEMGFIVLDEARWFSSSDEGIAQVETLVRRDRNRPSVFFWSLSNEERYHLNESGRRITQTLMRAVRRLDHSRPITSAVSEKPNVATVFDELDIVGINYNLDLYEEVHEKYPEKAIFSSENAATASMRGWYYPDTPDRERASAYDKDTNNWFRGREYTWKFIDEREWVMGGYQWTGLEYRGESTVWSRQCSISGAIDLFLQKKDAFYQNRSHWAKEPNIHMLPHWNIEDYGEPVRVWAYTNCEEAELFLNGKSLGKKTVEKHTHLEWMVDYEPGKIEVVGYIDGKVAASEAHETAGEPYALVLHLDNEVKTVNDVAIITCYTVDREGRFVPNATPTVTFHTNSMGHIISTGSDDCDPAPLGSHTRKMYAGYITAAAGIMTYRGNPYGGGTVEVYAHADGLKSARLKFTLA